MRALTLCRERQSLGSKDSQTANRRSPLVKRIFVWWPSTSTVRNSAPCSATSGSMSRLRSRKRRAVMGDHRRLAILAVGA